jgi:hypothetical protein
MQTDEMDLRRLNECVIGGNRTCLQFMAREKVFDKIITALTKSTPLFFT